MRRYKGMSGHQRPHDGESHEWQTPPEILQALGPFDMDPCGGSIDGLTRDWHGFVWCNPPYGPYVGEWLEKLAQHGNGIALVFARTETRWFFQTIWRRANGVLFLEGRLHFYRDGTRAQHNAGAPSVLVAYGTTAIQRLADAQIPGMFLRLGSIHNSARKEKAARGTLS